MQYLCTKNCIGNILSHIIYPIVETSEHFFGKYFFSFLYTFLCHVYQLETAVVLSATDSPLIVCRSDSKSNQLQMLTVSGLQLIVTVIWYSVGLCKLTPLSKEHKETFLRCFKVQSFSCFCFLCTCTSLISKAELRMS